MANNKPFIEQGNQTDDWTDVLKEVVNKASEKTRVATLGFVEEITQEYDKYEIVTVSPFPLEQGQTTYTIRAYASKGEEFNKGDIVVVLFTDRNFRNNIETDIPQESSNEESHPITCGVIIKTLYSKGEENNG